MTSWPLTAGLMLMRAGRLVQRGFGTAASERVRIEAERVRPRPFAPPKSLLRELTVRRTDLEDWPVFDVAPRDREADARVVYLHGGMYTHEITALHWKLVAQLAAEVTAQVTVPIYPLGARVGAAGVVATGVRLVRELLAADDRPLVLAGDSAGAGLAVAISQQLRERSGRERGVERLVLISPWLDAGCGDPRQPAISRRDPLIRIESLRAAATTYARGLPLDDPRLSPLNGPVAGLPPVSIWVGTADTLHPDSLRFAERARNAGIDVELHEVPGGIHDYPLGPFPESKAARWEIVRACRRPA